MFLKHDLNIDWFYFMSPTIYCIYLITLDKYFVQGKSFSFVKVIESVQHKVYIDGPLFWSTIDGP